MSKPRICLWCSSSPYSWEFIQEFSDEFDITSVAIQYADSSFDYDYTIKIKNPIKLKPFSTLFNLFFVIPYLTYLIAKYDKKCDCHVIHYLSDIIALAMFLANPKKPIVYFVYGSDVRKPSNFLEIIYKIILNKIDFIFCPTRSFYKKFIILKFGISEKKVIPILWYPINYCFRKLDDRTVNILREKWKLTRDYIIFSPRAVKKFYNHHLLIDALGTLNEDLKKKIQVVITGFGDEEFRKQLIEIGKAKNIEIIDLGRVLTPKEMAEIYNISVITVSIPKVDALGRSNLEAIMCGSLLLLNKDIEPYREVFGRLKFCILVEPNVTSIARNIENILENPKILRKLRSQKNFQKIADIVDWKKNKKIIVDHIQRLVNI